MTSPHTASYGSWRSPISADMVAGASVGLVQPALDGDEVCWIEARAAEAGRNVVVRRAPDGQISDLTPPPFNARSRAHEYGGGAYAVDRGTLFFSNYADGRIYRQPAGQPPAPLTPSGGMRYADLQLDLRRGRLVCVREDHSGDGLPVNTLVAVSLENGDAGQVLASGADFYASARLSPDGARLAFLRWNLPDMPWDGTELVVAEVAADGSLANPTVVAGGRTESIFQPEWSPDGTLYFVSDRSGWWNLYRWRGEQVEPLAPLEAEFGLPQWLFGLTTYGFRSAGEIICVARQHGADRLARLEVETGKISWVETPYATISAVRVSPTRAVFVGGAPTEPSALVQLDFSTGSFTTLRQAGSLTVDRGYLSAPEPIAFPTEGGQTAYGLFYPPRNRDYAGPAGERPPLLVLSHGGPTGATVPALSLNIQFWTSRGFGVVDVNYRGSTGYGRAYRELLNGQWGVADVDDCVNAARFLAARGDIDVERAAIRGGSAGGYTTLCALTFRDFFKAGASLYGISDLEALEQEGHKFELHYSHTLVGPYPEQRDLYRARSPIHFAERLSCPVILFQGGEDKVVPPNQSEKMYAAARANGLPVAYVLFEDEGHGFRKAANIRRVLEAELYFYSRVFGFELAELVEPVPIDNI